MGSVGDCFGYALCGSFFATLECECLDRNTFRTPAEARLGVFDYIGGWYNSGRRHSAIGYLGPMRLEERARQTECDVAPAARFRGTLRLLEPLRGSSNCPQHQP
jgi:putative transposase